ncbi:PA24B phospholipase, partial [Dromaius novaehollandiae]|nr:PA24B phospholipase [Dromaius novaehollandiae]
KLDVRLGYNLCPEEHKFLQKRKRVVANALKKVFHLERGLHEHEVPVIAVMATGGGLRAMSAMFGHLLALQKLNLLDCVTYLTGASGSTWCDTSHLLQPCGRLFRKCSYMMRYVPQYQEHGPATDLGKILSFSLELWSHDIMWMDKVWNKSKVTEASQCDLKCKLTDQRKALEHGQNPLPFYMVLNVKEEKFSTFKFREWTAFSPYEVAIPKYGASIPSEFFDSEFFMGRRVKKLPESRICYLEGLWTNIFTRNLLDGLYWSSNSNEFWERWAKDM